MSPVRELCAVLERRRVGEYHSLTLVAPRIAGAARPGQFVHLQVPEDRSLSLRRPFSIWRVGPAETVVRMRRFPKGRNTELLTRARFHARPRMDSRSAVDLGFDSSRQDDEEETP